MDALRNRPGLRFLAEAVLIVLVTVVTGVFHLGPLGIGGAAAIVWLSYVVIEYSLAHPREEQKTIPEPEVAEGVAEPEPPPRSETVRVIPRTPAPEPVAAEPDPEPQPEPEPVSDTVPVSATAADTEPQQWNVWDLERALRASGEPNDEREFLLIYLRDYAGPDGLLPLDFDDLVRESFPDVVGTPTG